MMPPTRAVRDVAPSATERTTASSEGTRASTEATEVSEEDQMKSTSATGLPAGENAVALAAVLSPSSTLAAFTAISTRATNAELGSVVESGSPLPHPAVNTGRAIIHVHLTAITLLKDVHGLPADRSHPTAQ